MDLNVILAVRNSPSKIAVIPEYPGSPRARVQWSFAGESSDLNCFRVAVQDNEKEIMWIDIAAGISAIKYGRETDKNSL